MIKRLLPYLLVSLIFALVLNLSLPSHSYVNTHDEDDNIVSGFLMSRNGLKMSKDIFTHHLPGAYLISEVLDKTFTPKNTDKSVYIHRSFVVYWNYLWAMIFLAIFGPFSLWLILVVELFRASYLFSLFQAENLIIYPMVYLILTLFMSKKIKPILSGFASGIITVLLSPLWPLILISAVQFLYVNIRKKRNIFIWVATFSVPVIWVILKIDTREFISQFFGYNALTYAPLLMKKPLLYSLAAFLAPGIVMFDFSLKAKIFIIQMLVVFIFLLNFNVKNLKKLIFFGIILGIIGFRSTPRFRNLNIDFHYLPWVITLATLCWYKYFQDSEKKGNIWAFVLIAPLIYYFINPTEYFPRKDQVGKMVIRYTDSSPIVNYLNEKKRDGDTLFTLPAHTLLYQQTGIKPFNKFLFFLPWMEQSPILFSRLLDSFQDGLPTYMFIDSIHFPYSPPEQIRKLLVNYREVKVIDSEPPVYILKSKQ